MRIVSLLPALTELVCALGRADWLVGVTHECDFPEGVERLPRLTRGRIPASLTSAEIDAVVAEQRGSLFELDEALLAELKPDLILTQEQCDVCAISEATVRGCASSLPGRPRVESVNPITLTGVFDMFRRIGELTDSVASSDRLLARFHSTAEEVARRIGKRMASPRRVLVLEWIDPPYCSGHWNPELVTLAGGVEVSGQAGERSRPISWEAIERSNPDTIIMALCGFSLDRTEREVELFRRRTEWASLMASGATSIILVDGSAYFSRPGPRLETSLRIAAAAIHPETCTDLAPAEGVGWRRFLDTN